MALPKPYRFTFTPAEVEFLAENEPITIVPLHRMDTLQMIGGYYGPFRPPIKQKVPLWLALTLKKKQKCQIQPPSWMDPERLQANIEDEANRPAFSALPFHYMEIAHLLLDCASDDIPRADLVRTLLRDLRERRQAKARQGLQTLDPHYLQMDNLGLMEMNEIRPFFTKSFNELRKLEQPSVPGDSQMSGSTAYQ
ncbi:DNA replication protein psf2 [Rhizophlyctis rosea]|uniref:DNA replication complex GINS protein PSF2 n=1 Tax=Rhizophlyctis rosea TaxID=64517 RepID=A0AAD5SH62_9FUNG|nr:DNA replication protein psf2 [Rhizophlyctis rosea]